MLKNYEKDPECPRCHQNTIPSSFLENREDNDFFAIACQNKFCRYIFDKNLKEVGIWTEDYKKVEWFT